ncbi:lytic transglycosylase domain-containing protein [Mucilaginibacter arboris]|uniref:Transglycosylase SLT domain-containing protein n=1 Tax=Mucilaginibacter arboris TaxID=2682090 RepID=A0A7K1SRM7_9SPHI|nr:lytic transglycosylase domain-containing protein [Mucilaginibacter arboris]MVN19965.1 transglycosylase SLT domain-containing protein [Mucilaginibacter arboris]
MKKYLIIAGCLLFTSFANAQHNRNNKPIQADTPVVAINLKAKQIVNLSSSAKPTKTVPSILRTDTLVPVPIVDELLLTSYQNMVYKSRLDSIQKKIPLNYNEYVQSYIDIYTAPKRKDAMSKIIGLAKYYFPIYEKAFQEAGIPDEIKYLSVVESALDPNAVSRVGATGLWQFMFATARLYGLKMDNYVDERKDPVQASHATARYLKDAYNDFGDWLLAIASYNCGKGNVIKAMQRSGGNDFWSIRNYLPAETRGYVPAYIAITYVMNFYKKHQIIPQECNFSTKNDTVLVNKLVSLNNLSNALEIDPSEMAILNPSYKKRIVNGTADKPKRIIIPKTVYADFANVYAALNDSDTEAAPRMLLTSAQDGHPHQAEYIKYHRIKKGERLSEIADRYGVEVQDLKVWNHLHTVAVVPGQKLLIKTVSAEVASPEKKSIKSYYTYRVRKGDTLNVIAEKYEGATVQSIKALNTLKGNQLRPGMTLKINRS